MGSQAVASPEPAKPWRTFIVSVAHYGSTVITARTRSAAVASAWRSDAFHSYSFKKFLAELRPTARLTDVPKDKDGYAYVRRVYGVDPTIGQRARLLNEGNWTGREGTVLYPGTSSAHVKIIVDGEEWPVIVHPANVVLL